MIGFVSREFLRSFSFNWFISVLGRSNRRAVCLLLLLLRYNRSGVGARGAVGRSRSRELIYCFIIGNRGLRSSFHRAVEGFYGFVGWLVALRCLVGNFRGVVGRFWRTVGWFLCSVRRFMRSV